MGVELKVGDKVFFSRREKTATEKLEEWVIVKIGRKYFYVGRTMDWSESFCEKFSLKDLKHQRDYGHKWNLYLSKQDFKDKQEYALILKSLREIFSQSHYNCEKKLSLSQLREIAKIMKL